MEISIRRFHRQDIEPLYRAVIESKESLIPWMDWCTEDYDLNDSLCWVKYAIEAWDQKLDYAFVIVDCCAQALLGCVGLNNIDTQHRTAKLGYWVKTSRQNRGVATAAASEAARFAFNRLGLNRIEIEIAPGNAASRAVAIKLGAIYEGRFRNKLMLRGKPMAAHCYSLIPSDLM